MMISSIHGAGTAGRDGSEPEETKDSVKLFKCGKWQKIKFVVAARADF